MNCKLEIKVKQKEIFYPIYIGKNLISKIDEIFPLENFSKIFVLTDKNVAKFWLKKCLNSFDKNRAKELIVDCGEKIKSTYFLQKIWKFLLKERADRKSLLINLGGGTIGDLGGFGAAAFLRGINFLQVPTTLISQVDASVGGKVGINFLGIKNVLGSFYHPIGVLIDVDTLKTLPKREFLSGFAEMIKMGAILDEKYFKLLSSKHPLDFKDEELINLIKRAVQLKAKIVSLDEKEAGLRRILNFAHTIGHAIESLSQKTKTPLLHGEAISLGMIAETKISHLMGLIGDEDFEKIVEAILKAKLPVVIKGIDAKKVMKLIYFDKKVERGEINWTLLQKIGKATVNQKVPKEIVEQSLKWILK